MLNTKISLLLRISLGTVVLVSGYLLTKTDSSLKNFKIATLMIEEMYGNSDRTMEIRNKEIRNAAIRYKVDYDVLMQYYQKKDENAIVFAESLITANGLDEINSIVWDSYRKFSTPPQYLKDTLAKNIFIRKLENDPDFQINYEAKDSLIEVIAKAFKYNSDELTQEYRAIDLY